MTPEQLMQVFDHCTWTVFQAVVAWLGLMVLIDIFFGGKE